MEESKKECTITTKIELNMGSLEGVNLDSMDLLLLRGTLSMDMYPGKGPRAL